MTIVEVSCAQDVSLEVLTERYGSTVGIDKFQIQQFERKCSVRFDSRNRRLASTRAMVQAAAAATQLGRKRAN